MYNLSNYNIKIVYKLYLNYLYIIYLLLIYLYMFIYKDRYSALQGQPLQAYFKGETLHERPDGSLFKSNMYLAEDRILCFELVAKKGANYLLKYVRVSTIIIIIITKFHFISF